MVILRSQNKITDFFMFLAWASPFIAGAGFRRNLSIVEIKITLACAAFFTDSSVNSDPIFLEVCKPSFRVPL